MSARSINYSLIALLFCAASGSSAAVHAASATAQVGAQQADLDAQCQAARQKVLNVERASYVEECVRNRHPQADRAGCERFYADHGNAAGGRAPLHMDLPECVAAHDFRQSAPRR